MIIWLKAVFLSALCAQKCLGRYNVGWENIDKGHDMSKLTQAALRSLIKKPGPHSDGCGRYFRVLGEGKAYFV